MDGASVVTVVGELEPAGVPQHVGMNEKGEFRTEGHSRAAGTRERTTAGPWGVESWSTAGVQGLETWLASPATPRTGSRWAVAATVEERAHRKRRLIKGPREFRDVRGDQPKKKS